MKKQDKKSFADLAKDITKKYPRAEWDSIEAADMERELENLMALQEQKRASMGLNTEEEMACGGKLKMDGTEITQFIPSTDYSLDFLGNNLIPQPTAPIIAGLQQSPSMNRLAIDEAMVGYDADKIANSVGNIGEIQPITQLNKQPSFWDKNKQYAPYAISGLSNIAGNLLLANMAKKNQPTFTPATAVPEKINLEPQAEQLRKSASVAKNVALRNARNLGTNVGETLANMGNIGAAVDRGLGENLTNLYLGQEQANVGTANQFNLANAEMQNRGNLINTQLKSQTLQDQLGYLSGALGTIPGVMKDIRMDKADKETRSIMEDYYNNLGGRNYMPLGSLFKSKDGRFTYKVKGYDISGQPIIEKV